MGVLHITVIRAENLGTQINNSHVVCYQGNKHGHTRPAKGQNPQYTENEISFEVDDDQIPLNVQVIDIDRGVQLIQSEISFDEIKQEQLVPPNKEFWLYDGNDDPSAPRLRLKLSYVQNEVLKWDTEVNMLVGEIKNDAGVLQQVRIFIEQLRQPFGFLQREIEGV